ncbi:putative acyl carrier protein [Bacteroides ovatus]|jgi:putative acyl carrier protein|uniref:phosphopantetheine-binding protein n=1 Tax=Bacteroides TaxID=816 RepID=UPI000E8EE314|nr:MULTISPECIES: phosphopantetheine-binding protein [Bacteroides]MCS3177393.1 acyl carrier protein [Candidatus Bacteroides intestinigallinarum]RGN60787.1 acyl carrier protein [Bacteroides sp. OM05-10AA]RGQ65187.1 acyl carrier protein [Bacteroides sp. AF27-33]CAG9888833.1 putative acyl carrier protein [Bacteroides ovatus]
MELKEFIDSFIEQFDDTEASEITSDTKFKDLDEWSSLIAMGVIALVRTQYGKTVTGKEIRACETVKDLFELVLSK